MSLYLSIQLFELEEQEEKTPAPYRTVDVFLEDGIVKIVSKDEDPEYDFTTVLGEQMSNEFLIQTEGLEIRKWNPMYYSPAFSGDYKCSWVLDYHGLKDESVMHSGVGTYPKAWQLLMDLIDALNDRKTLLQESVHIAAEHIEPSTARMTDMVHILSLMGVPQSVITAGMIRAAYQGQTPKAEARYRDFVKDNFDRTVEDLLAEFGDDSQLEPAERRVALLERVKASKSLYFKKIVLAELMSDLTAVKAKMDAGLGFSDPVMDKGEMGIYYAEMISNLEVLGADKQAGATYSRLVDMYKTVFVSYYLDSVNGVIYQTQGTTAGVYLRRGEYDWRAVRDEMTVVAEPMRKELALFLAGLWRREADEALVKDGNREGSLDVPDMTVLKVVMSRAKSAAERKDNKVVLSVLRRMMEEGEQILAPIRAADPDMELIEKGGVDDVSTVAVSFLGLEDDECDTMAAVFTSMDELGEIDEDDMEAIPVKMVLEFVKSMSRLDGILIDPFSDRFTISKEKIAELLDEIKKDQTISI